MKKKKKKTGKKAIDDNGVHNKLQVTFFLFIKVIKVLIIIISRGPWTVSSLPRPVQTIKIQ